MFYTGGPPFYEGFTIGDPITRDPTTAVFCLCTWDFCIKGSCINSGKVRKPSCQKNLIFPTNLRTDPPGLLVVGIDVRGMLL